MALNRKNALFAGSDGGGANWAVIASLIETCKLNDLDPYAYLADTLIKIVDRHLASQIDVLLTWASRRSKARPEDDAYDHRAPVRSLGETLSTTVRQKTRESDKTLDDFDTPWEVAPRVAAA